MREYSLVPIASIGPPARTGRSDADGPGTRSLDLMSKADSPAADAAAFESLLRQQLGPAYGMALRLTGNSADAEDLVQEAALLAFRGFHSFQQGTNFKAWFFRILTNAYFGKRRKEKRRPSTVDLDEIPDFYMYHRSTEAGLFERTDDPATLLLSEMDVAQVTQAIDALPEEYRVVAVLYFLEDMSYQDIASVLDIPVGTVRSRLHRARKMLQKTLWEIAEEAGIVSRLAAEGSS